MNRIIPTAVLTAGSIIVLVLQRAVRKRRKNSSVESPEEDAFQPPDEVFDEDEGEDEVFFEEEEEEGEELDPLAEEMIKMMGEESDRDEDDPDSQRNVDRLMEMEMLKAMEDEGKEEEEDNASVELPHGLGKVEVEVTVELGQTNIPLTRILNLAKGSIISFDALDKNPATVLVDGKPYSEGEVVTVLDNFGVRLINMEEGG